MKHYDVSQSKDSYLSLTQVLGLLGISRSTAHRWLREGRLKGHRVGRQWRFSPEALDDFIQSQARLADSAELREASQSLTNGNAKPPTTLAELVELLLETAKEERATALHFSTISDGVVFRLRGRGGLRTVYRFPPALGGQVLDHLEGLAETGAFTATAIETTRGKTLVLAFDETLEAPQLKLESLMSPRLHKTYAKHLSLTWGLHIITGAPGSGRTTLGQTCLLEVADWKTNTVALSDPKLQLPETVVQIPRPRGSGTLELLDTVMKLDPDTVYCDEVEDADLAAELCRTALSGHRVLLCLKSAGATEAIAHLLEMGLPASLLVQSCRSILSQTLVRGLCTTCKRGRPASKDELALFRSHNLKRPAQLYEANACPQCSRTGYTRRVAAHQLRMPDRELSRAIFQYSSGELGIDELRAVVETPQTAQLAISCLELVTNGVTTLEEVQWCL